MENKSAFSCKSYLIIFQEILVGRNKTSQTLNSCDKKLMAKKATSLFIHTKY